MLTRGDQNEHLGTLAAFKDTSQYVVSVPMIEGNKEVSSINHGDVQR